RFAVRCGLYGDRLCHQPVHHQGQAFLWRLHRPHHLRHPNLWQCERGHELCDPAWQPDDPMVQCMEPPGAAWLQQEESKTEERGRSLMAANKAKGESTFKTMVYPVIILVVICVVCSAALAVLNDVTAPIIAANEAAQTQEAYQIGRAHV